MSVSLQILEKPILKKTKMNCDGVIDKSLLEYHMIEDCFSKTNFTIFIGKMGIISQPNNSICINATNSATGGQTNSSALYINPIRAYASSTPVLAYNITTKEVTYNSSSIKYKKNVIDLTGNSENLYKLRVREYDWKSCGTHYVGLIAEEAYEADPNFTWSNDGEACGIDWNNILLYAVEEIKKLKKEILLLKNANPTI